MVNRNQSILKGWTEKGIYGGSSEFIEQVLKLETPGERFAAMRGMFYKNVETFDWTPLWNDEEDIPDWDEEIKDQHVPALVFFPADNVADGEKRGCILVAPGGGYDIEADTTEGWPVIARLTKEGFHCALLVYRLRPYSRRASLKDAQRAIRLLRYKADEWNILKDKIGMIGGSAGGNLTCMTGVHYDLGDIHAADPVEKESCRLDACISMYGIFSACSFPGAENFVDLGSDAAGKKSGLSSIYSCENIEDAFFQSAEKWVTPNTPPFFMWQACDNDDPRQMFIFAGALADAGVRFEAHIYPFGAHGIGLADGVGHPGGRGRDEHLMHWVEQAVEWLKIYGFA